MFIVNFGRNITIAQQEIIYSFKFKLKVRRLLFATRIAC